MRGKTSRFSLCWERPFSVSHAPSILPRNPCLSLQWGRLFRESGYEL